MQVSVGSFLSLILRFPTWHLLPAPRFAGCVVFVADLRLPRTFGVFCSLSLFFFFFFLLPLVTIQRLSYSSPSRFHPDPCA